MKLYIPKLGDELVLAENWTFNLYREHRNAGLIEVVSSEIETQPYWKWDTKPVCLWSDTVLIVDRIYIRKGGANFDSVTFRMKSTPQFQTKLKPRFWAKLDDVNRMVIHEG